MCIIIVNIPYQINYIHCDGKLENGSADLFDSTILRKCDVTQIGSDAQFKLLLGQKDVWSDLVMQVALRNASVWPPISENPQYRDRGRQMVRSYRDYLDLQFVCSQNSVKHRWIWHWRPRQDLDVICYCIYVCVAVQMLLYHVSYRKIHSYNARIYWH